MNPTSTTAARYITGYVLLVVLRLGAFGILMVHQSYNHEVLSHTLLMGIFLAAAILQLLVQLYFFLHVGEESKPRWQLISTVFALFVVLVIVGGSLWIMAHLSHPDLSAVYSGQVVTPLHEQD